MFKPLGRLNLREFSHQYKEQKDYFESNKEEFVDQIIRRRSFFTKRRVEFANYKEAEEIS